MIEWRIPFHVCTQNCSVCINSYRDDEVDEEKLKIQMANDKWNSSVKITRRRNWKEIKREEKKEKTWTIKYLEGYSIHATLKEYFESERASKERAPAPNWAPNRNEVQFWLGFFNQRNIRQRQQQRLGANELNTKHTYNLWSFIHASQNDYNATLILFLSNNVLLNGTRNWLDITSDEFI